MPVSEAFFSKSFPYVMAYIFGYFTGFYWPLLSPQNFNGKKVFEHVTSISSTLRWSSRGTCYQVGTKNAFSKASKAHRIIR